MIDKQFKKEAFKESVKENVKFLYRKKLEEATGTDFSGCMLHRKRCYH